MATVPKKLPSGNWRCQVSYTDKEGKRRYKSFTAKTKKEAMFAAEEFEIEKERLADVHRWTLGEAMDNYIELKKPVLAASTITGYKRIRNNCYPDLMEVQMAKITEDMLNDAVRKEMHRTLNVHGKRNPEIAGKTQSPKSIKNSMGFVQTVIKWYMPQKFYRVDTPKVARKIRTLPEPSLIYEAVKGTEIELAVLLAMWLSFTMSEMRGLTKSKSIDGDYITIREVVVYTDGQDVRKDIGKNDMRNRRLKMPPRIKELVDAVEGDVLVPYSPSGILKKFKRYVAKVGITDMTFHDLRHENASVMARLQIADKYAQERGGWKTDYIMKKIYMETFSEARQEVDEKVDNFFSEIVGCTNGCTKARNTSV